MNEAAVDLGASLSPEEESYFESGGEGVIPTDGGERSAGDDEQPTAADAGDAGQGEPKAERMVSLAALHEERTRRRDLDRQLRDRDRELAELRGKFSIIDRLSQPTEAEMRPPTPEEDIFGAVRNTTETVAQLQRRLEHREAVERVTAARNELVGAYRADAMRFETANPDFRAAYNHLLASRAAELQAIGYDDPGAISEALQADELAIAQRALTSGKSPAELIYALAQGRGYRRAEAAQGAGRAAEKLGTIQRGQVANKSLSATGGAAGETEMTPERLLKMSNDEFEAWVNKNPTKARRMFGG